MASFQDRGVLKHYFEIMNESLGRKMERDATTWLLHTAHDVEEDNKADQLAGQWMDFRMRTTRARFKLDSKTLQTMYLAVTEKLKMVHEGSFVDEHVHRIQEVIAEASRSSCDELYEMEKISRFLVEQFTINRKLSCLEDQVSATNDDGRHALESEITKLKVRRRAVEERIALKFKAFGVVWTT